MLQLLKPINIRVSFCFVEEKSGTPHSHGMKESKGCCMNSEKPHKMGDPRPSGKDFHILKYASHNMARNWARVTALKKPSSMHGWLTLLWRRMLMLIREEFWPHNLCTTHIYTEQGSHCLKVGCNIMIRMSTLKTRQRMQLAPHFA